MTWLIIILVLLALAYLFFQILVLRARKKWSEKDIIFFETNWRQISLNRDHQQQLLEADKLFDHMLRKRGYKGSLGEKLKKKEKLFSDINSLWYAHKLRNRLAHEVNVRITPNEVNRALSAFRKAFRDIGLDCK